MNTNNIFYTERLILKPTSEEDAAFIFELLNTPKWLQFIGDRNVTSLEKAKEYIKEKIQPQFERLGYANYTVIRKSDQAKMGSCGLYSREGLDEVDIGFAFLPEYEGKGYAYEAACKMKDMAFDTFGIPEIWAITAKDNQASQKLLEKIGLVMSGTTVLPNENEELLLYKIKK